MIAVTYLSPEESRLDTAKHEAAHVVVGVALGLRLRHATARPSEDTLGFAWFQCRGHDASHAIMYAAGCAWERRVGGEWRHTWDEKQTRVNLPGRGGFEAAVRAADAMLRGLVTEHALLTRALMRRDVTGADITRIARGERI